MEGQINISYRRFESLIPARHQFNLKKGQTGAITFVQRFGSSLNTNIHFHSLFIDGVYNIPKNSTSVPKFYKIKYPTDKEIKDLSEDISKRIITNLHKNGYLEKFKNFDPLLEISDSMAQISSASISHMIAMGENARRPVRRVLQDPHEGQRSSKLCYSSSGFSLHAATVIPKWDRKRLFNSERVCQPNCPFFYNCNLPADT